MIMRHSELIESIIDKLKAVDGLQATVLGGSWASGTQRADSDIDMGLYYNADYPLDIQQVRNIANEFNDLPDPVRFLKVAANRVAAAAKAAKGEPPRVAACGECAPVLWAQGKPDAAIQLEHLWDEIAKACDVDILCGYVLKTSQREQGSHIQDRISAEHSAVWSQ